MACIFTTQFEYNRQKYDAIVSVITKEDVVSFKTEVLDLDMHILLSEG